MARKKYMNPPIIEALCELTFELPSDTPVNFITLPGLLQAKLGDAYSGQPREQRVQSVTVPVGSELDRIQVQDQMVRLQLLTKDGTRVLSVGPNTLGISMLAPYGDDGWEGEFQPRIKAALSAYMAIAAPLAVTRIGMRYINQIELPDPKANAESYFTLNQEKIDNCRLTAFLKRLEYQSDDDIKILLTYATITPKKTQHFSILT